MTIRETLIFMNQKPIQFALIWLAVTIVPVWLLTAEFSPLEVI